MTTSVATYNRVAKILHWLIAAAIIGMLILGWVMADDDMPNGLAKFAMFQWHKSIGITILALSLFRLVWRLINPPPSLPQDLPKWQRISAQIAYIGFYFLMLAMPFSGWALNSATPYKITLYGLIPLPNLPIIPSLPDEAKHAWKGIFAESHETMAYILAALIFLHIGAALKHHFIRRDDMLLRMSPQFLVSFLRNIRGEK